MQSPAPQIILGIESSCDETAAAVFGDAGLLAHAVHSQTALHADYGGVVPELASRDHVRKLIPLVDTVIREAGAPCLTGIAYTRGPGLVGALLTGATVAAGLGMGLGVPVLGVHHMEGHLLSPLLEDDAPAFPFVALLVSGGHTMLVHVRAVGDYCLLGQSLDDAVGEAFDKTAQILGLGYPGGPALAALAQDGDPARFAFPRPMVKRPGLDFSFSGLKTAVMLAARAGTPDDYADVAAGFEQAVIETLVAKCRRALRAVACQRLVVAGGVGANRRLRAVLADNARRHGFSLHFPRAGFCTDNAAMIAHIGWLRAAEMHPAIAAVDARARWPLTELEPPPAAGAAAAVAGTAQE